MKIDFHILEEATQQGAWLYACQLLEKAYAEQRRVFVYVNTRQDAERFDTLLWTYRDDSFIPHQIYNPDSVTDIEIGYGEKPLQHSDMLLNLSHSLPSFHSAFQQMIEIVFSDPHVQQLARERYKHYREQNYAMNTYKIKA